MSILGPPASSIAVADAIWIRSAHETSGHASLIGSSSRSALERPALGPALISLAKRIEPIAPPAAGHGRCLCFMSYVPASCQASLTMIGWHEFLRIMSTHIERHFLSCFSREPPGSGARYIQRAVSTAITSVAAVRGFSSAQFLNWAKSMSRTRRRGRRPRPRRVKAAPRTTQRVLSEGVIMSGTYGLGRTSLPNDLINRTLNE